jgi:hypothetical protein
MRPVVALLVSTSAAWSLAATPPPSPAEYRRIAAEAEADLERHVVAVRYPRTVDRERGGYHATYGRDWTPRPDSARFIVYLASVTHL